MARLGWGGRCSVDRCPENAASCLRHRLAAGVLGFGGEGTQRSYPTHHTLRAPAQQSTPLASRTPRGLCGEVPWFLPTPLPCRSCGFGVSCWWTRHLCPWGHGHFRTAAPPPCVPSVWCIQLPHRLPLPQRVSQEMGGGCDLTQK